MMRFILKSPLLTLLWAGGVSVTAVTLAGQADEIRRASDQVG